jgi:hypothetical protein
LAKINDHDGDIGIDLEPQDIDQSQVKKIKEYWGLEENA